MRYNAIDRVILFGGSPLLVAAVDSLSAAGFDVRVYTAPRQAVERLDAGGLTLAERLTSMGQPFVVTEDINAEPSLRAAVSPSTLGLGLGEAWSFSEALIAAFGGRLLDFMGIPLPRYRGGAHYSWMILRGDRAMGCNLQVINRDMVQGEFDSGEIVKSRHYELSPAARLPADYFREANAVEIAFIQEFIAEVRAGRDFALEPPDERRSLFLPRLNTLAQGLIDWAWNGRDIERFICAFDDPYAGASTSLDGQVVQLKHAFLDDSEARFHPFQSGLVTRVNADEGVVIATTGGHLRVGVVLVKGAPVTATVKPGMRFLTPREMLERAAAFRASYGAGGAIGQPGLPRAIADDETFAGERVVLRLLTAADCSERYVAWLNDPQVNRYLETRWRQQDLEAVRAFVAEQRAGADSYLFAIIDRDGGEHIGNIKVGPIQRHHGYADVSYFIGERSRWGRGYASDAIRVATRIGFERLGLQRLQAGLYEDNKGSGRALEKAGYVLEARHRQQLQSGDGRQDHLWYSLLRDEWEKTR